MAKPLVTGEVVFDENTNPFSGATITVRLEDVGMMDGPATVVAEQVIRNVSYDGNGKKSVSFTLQGSLPNDNSSYSVSSHVSMDGSDDIQKGDYITKQSYPVLTHGNPNRVSVHVKKV
jgi:uncharacterized lipoprotein YbaY